MKTWCCLILCSLSLFSCMDKSKEMCMNNTTQKLVAKLSAKQIAVQTLEEGYSNPLSSAIIQMFAPLGMTDPEVIAEGIEKDIRFKKLLKSRKEKDDTYYCSAVINLGNKSNKTNKEEYLVDYIVKDKGEGYIEVQLMSVAGVK